MKTSGLTAFFLGCGFNLKIAGYEEKTTPARKAVTLLLSLFLTAITLGVFVVAGPLIGRNIYNKKYSGLDKTDQKINRASAQIVTPAPAARSVPVTAKN